MKFILIIPVFFFGHLNFAQVLNNTLLDYNNVKTILNDEGGFFYNASASTPGYEIPKGSGLHTIYAGSYWIGAKDEFGNLHVSGTTYSTGGSGSAFHSGPTAESIAYGSTNYSNLYQNALWKVSDAEIQNHIANYQNTGYIIPNSILTWPGNGDVNLGVASHLAPFIDINNNGIYEPAQGDYPDIRGDQAVYIIMNDESFNPDGNQLGIELHAMFYQFAAGNYLNNTTFLNTKVYNRSNMNYNDYRQALFVDLDIGNYSDDYIGCNVSNNVLFGYNGDDTDEPANGQSGYGNNPPCQGVVALSHQLENAGTFNNTQNNLDTSLWLLMNSQWDDSTNWINPLTNSATNFMYAGNPNDPNAWHEQSNNNPTGDRRGLLTIAEPTLPAGGSICADYAFIYDRSGSRLTNVQNVINLAEMIQNSYDISSGFPCQSLNTISVQELTDGIAFELYPNPSNGTFNIDFNQNESFDLEIKNAIGSIVFKESFIGKTASIKLNQANGIYLVTVKTANGSALKKLIIQK